MHKFLCASQNAELYHGPLEQAKEADLTQGFLWINLALSKGGFKSEDTGKIYVSNINIPNHYPEQKISISCLLF